MANSTPILTLSITALAHDGRGIGFLPASPGVKGKAVFVAGALPGQKVACQIVRHKKSWLEANLVDIADHGSSTVAPICPHARLCGGCPLQTMPESAQLFWKETIVMDAMSRLGGFNRDALKEVWGQIIPCSQRTHFRNKIELAFGTNSAGEPALGFRRRASHEVFDLVGCALTPDASMEITSSMRGLAKNATQLSHDFWRFFILRSGQDANGRQKWLAICITRPGSPGDRAIVRSVGRSLLEQNPDLASFIHEERKSESPLAKGERRICCLDASGSSNEAAALFHLLLLGRKFRLDASSFFQVNACANDSLARLVVEMDSMAPGRAELLDAYCGVGAPGLLLAPRYEKTTGIEYDPGAVSNARFNAAGISQCRFHAGDTGRILSKLQARPGQFSTALLDPPRQGLDKKAMAALLSLRPQTIIYISCNPATLARDSRILHDHYQLTRMGAVDLFPHTPHVECCSLWTKRLC